MRLVKFIYLFFGIGLLGFVVYETNLTEVSSLVAKVGWGLALLIGLYFLAFLLDSIGWMLTVASLKPSLRWCYRFWKLRMIGEAFNNTVPAAGMAGEPVKSILLKKHYGIGYNDGIASIILARTINMLSLIVFLAISFYYMWQSTAFSPSVKSLAGIGFMGATLATALFFFAQRLRLSSLAGTFLARSRFRHKIENFLQHIHDMDEKLVTYYTKHGWRLTMALLLAFANWVLGAVEIYYTLQFLGHPITWQEAWIIEGVSQMVRSGTFFIPASIGAQEGAFVLVCTAITGNPSLGFAVGIVRRIREILWVIWGFLIGWIYSHSPEPEKGSVNLSE